MIGDRHSKTVFIGFLALISLCYARSLDSDLAGDNEVVVLEKREEDEVVLDLELENRDNEDMTELEERLENIIALEEKGAEYMYKKGGKDTRPPTGQDGFFFVPDDGRRKRPRKKNKFSFDGGELSRTLF
ncbi:uncharacterized protein LOC134826072 isoform X2 [Bolinopsis microptera]|uniref:uncharacterized protein LOC134826072 isoform X2 n=1 Tax=Bolinopsis microptera TaxID=2820187 RepID=UPI00307A4FE4